MREVLGYVIIWDSLSNRANEVRPDTLRHANAGSGSRDAVSTVEMILLYYQPNFWIYMKGTIEIKQWEFRISLATLSNSSVVPLPASIE